MTEEAAVTIAQIRTLVGERQRFDEWLTALEARRAETPVRVFERVHGDYVARRDAVIENLHQHVGTLEALEQDLNSRLWQLETQLAEREDERAEAMLRTAVGEFDSERWELTRHEVEASLAQLGQDREALMAEAEDTRALLASARHRPAEPEPVVEPEPEPELVSTPEAEPIPAAVAAATPVFMASEFDSADADIEAAFSISDDVVAHSASSQTTHDYPGTAFAAQSSAAVQAEIDTDVDAAVDALDALDAAPGATIPESLDNIDVFGAPEVTPRNAPAADHGARSSSDGRTAWSNGTPAAPAATHDTFDDLAFLRSVTESGNGSSVPAARSSSPTDQAKTLRCTECGTMNFPTEWYCERCGGELAAF